MAQYSFGRLMCAAKLHVLINTLFTLCFLLLVCVFYRLALGEK